MNDLLDIRVIRYLNTPTTSFPFRFDTRNVKSFAALYLFYKAKQQGFSASQSIQELLVRLKVSDTIREILYSYLAEYKDNNFSDIADISDNSIIHLFKLSMFLRSGNYTSFQKRLFYPIILSVLDVKPEDSVSVFYQNPIPLDSIIPDDYQNTKRIEEKKQALAIKDIVLSKKQREDAKLLRRNAQMVINTLDDQTQKYAGAMETITESTTIPLDIIAPILGTFTADKLHKTFSPNGHYGALFKGLGALLAFLPAAMSEIYFVGQQRQAKRCGILIAKNNLQNSEKFLDPTQKENQIKTAVTNWNFNSNKSNSFMSFKKF